MFPEEITNVSDYGLLFALIMIIALLSVPRRHALIPVFMTACYLTLGQVINVAGLNFTLMRVIIMFGWIRVVVRGEYRQLKLTSIDLWMALWVSTSFVVYNILWQTQQALINQLGFVYNAIGIYFLFRCLIGNSHDVIAAVKAITYVIVPLAICMLLESVTGRNLFAGLGGVEEFSEVRDGMIRAQGAFAHPILAGTFGATLIPLFFSLYVHNKQQRWLAMLGGVAATIITITSASSGPLLTYLSGLAGLAAWCLRRHMRLLRWGLFVGVLALHLVMNAPVWFLFARLSQITGGTGWHRSELIDQAIRHLDEWWLVGTKYTAHWMPYALVNNPDMSDITNHYLKVGVNGGLLSMVMFIGLVIAGFVTVGRELQAAEDRPRAAALAIWGLGAALFAHAMAFLSVSYFDQIMLFWLLLMAMIAVGGRFPAVSSIARRQPLTSDIRRGTCRTSIQ